MKEIKRVYFLIFAVLIFSGASLLAEEKKPFPTVYASFYPLAYFAQRIGGGKIRVICPLPAGKDPDQWLPDRETISRFQKADLLLANGPHYEKWITTVSLPSSKLIETSKDLEKDFIRFSEKVTHSHGPAGFHSHEGIDGHTWMNPLNAILHAEAIELALIEHYPENTPVFEKGFAELKADLTGLDKSLKEIAANLKNVPFFCSHPAFNYPARRYGWEIKNLNLSPDQFPDAKQLEEIRESMARRPFRFIIWEEEPKTEIAKKLKDDFGLQNVIFSTCETHSKEETLEGFDYIKVMKKNIENLRTSVSR